MSQFHTHADVLPGGIVRSSIHGGAQPREESVPHAALAGREGIVHRGVVREDGSGTLMQDRGQGGHIDAPQTGRGILATAKSSAGPTANFRAPGVTVELEPGNPASRTSLRTAVSLGLLVETAPGIYAESGTSMQGLLQADREAQQRAAEGAGQVADAAVVQALAPETEFGQAIADLRQDSFDRAVAGGAVAVASGEPADFEAVARALVQNEGMDPERAQALVSQAHAAYEGIVARGVAPLGIDATEKDAFYDWCRASRKDELVRAVQQLTGTNSLAGFKALAVQYQTQRNQAGVDQFRAMGWDAMVDRTTGQLMVSPGQGRAFVKASEL